MAISKILCMKEASVSYPGKHLQVAIDYILNPRKTMGGTLVGSLNCQKEYAYEQMKETKISYAKYFGRQGYHLIISFNEGEIDENTAFNIVEEFANEYIGKEYEAVYVVHNNTKHIHGHIIWNSVKVTDGKKYRYEKGDWERIIQPLVNKLCDKYGIETLDIEEGRKNSKYEWNLTKDGPFVWNNMIRRDFDACIIQATDFDMFLDMLDEKGYEIKLGKYLAVKPKGMQKFRRSKSLGMDYTVDRINERIATENFSNYASKVKMSPRIVTKSYKRIKRAKLTGIQKRYFARLYRLGKIKKRPYSQYYKYKDDIKKMHKLQKEYLFLARHGIKELSDIDEVITKTKVKLKAVTDGKRKLYKEKKNFFSVFKIVEEMQVIEECEELYKAGDKDFKFVHDKWINFEKQISDSGYSYEELKNLNSYYKENISEAVKTEKKLKHEIHIAEEIKTDIESSGAKAKAEIKEIDKIRDKGSRRL